MTENSLNFLPHFLQEEIYNIGGALNRSPSQEPLPSRPETKSTPTIQAPEPITAPAPSLSPKITVEKEAISLPTQVVVSIENYPHSLAMSQKGLLEKMMAAVGLSFDQITLVDTVRLTQSYAYMMEHSMSHRVLGFGPQVAFQHTLAQPQPYQILRIHKSGLLIADPLAVLENDAQLKKRLWTQMQVLFSKM